MKVLLVEEWAERERLALQMLQYFLERAGHRTRITDIWERERDFIDFRPDVVIDNTCDGIEHFLGKGHFLNETHRYINFTWEQFANAFNLTRFRYDEIVQSSVVDGRICWGDHFKNTLLEENPGMDPSRMRKTGSIKHAIASLFQSIDKPSLEALYDYDFDRYDRVILVAENFKLAMKNPEDFRGNSGQGTDYPYYYELIRRLQRMKPKFTDAIDRMARQRSDWLFLMRMHPGDEPSYYKTYEERLDHPNVAFNRSGCIDPLLRIADGMVASRSGSLCDAYIAGTPAGDLVNPGEPIAYTGVIQTSERDFAVSREVEDFDTDELESIIEAYPTPEGVEELEAKWFASTGLDAFENVVDFIEEIAGRPALPKKAPADAYASLESTRRAIGNLLRLTVWDRKSPREENFDYDRLFELLVESLGLDDAETSRPTPTAAR